MEPRRRLDAGPLIAIPGALLLLVSLFVDWYEPDVSAFTVFEVLDLLLAAIAIAGLLGAVERLGTSVPGGPELARRLLPLGVLALVIVLSQAINHPPAALGQDPSIGLWLALGGAAMLAVGALLSATRISLAINVEGQAARSGADPPRDTDKEDETARLDVSRRGEDPRPAAPRADGPPPSGPQQPGRDSH